MKTFILFTSTKLPQTYPQANKTNKSNRHFKNIDFFNSSQTNPSTIICFGTFSTFHQQKKIHPIRSSFKKLSIHTWPNLMSQYNHLLQLQAMIIFVTNVCYSMKIFEFFWEKLFSWQKFTFFVKSKKGKRKEREKLLRSLCTQAYWRPLSELRNSFRNQLFFSGFAVSSWLKAQWCWFSRH